MTITEELQQLLSHTVRTKLSLERLEKENGVKVGPVVDMPRRLPLA